MKVILLSLLLTWVHCEPPTSGYSHNSYDDPYAEVGHGQPHSHSSSAYHQPAPHGPHERPHEHHEHEIVIQQHHHSIEEAPVKIIQHGHPEAPAHYRPVAASAYKSTPSRVRTHPSSYGSGHGYHSPPSYASPSHSYSKAPTYESPVSKDPYSPAEGAGLHAGYNSYKINDYKAYAAPVTHADDYAQDYNGDYNTPPPPTYTKSNSYSSPAYGSPVAHSPGYSSYASEGYEHDHSHTHTPSYQPKYPSKAKGYRTPSSYSSHSQSYGTPHSHSYGTPSKPVYSSSYPKGNYAVKPAYSQHPKLSYPVSTPVKSVYGPPKSSYSSYAGTPKGTYGVPKSYYRTQWKGYEAPGYKSHGHSSYKSAASYAPAAPSYSYGSPSSKGFGYSYSPYAEGAEKGYTHFVADESYGGSSAHESSPYDDRPSHESESLHEDEIDPYSRDGRGGGYDSGSSHY